MIRAHFFDSHPCNYLAGKTARIEYLIIDSVLPEEFDLLLERGWRRFGLTYFRPACKTCRACEPLRIPVGLFEPTRSQRRAAQKCSSLEIEVGTPKVDPARLELYRRWHIYRAVKKDWPHGHVCEAEYAAQFCTPHRCATEMAYYQDGELVAVGIVDQTETSLSSVFFYFDPRISKLSPGVASVLCEIQYARARRLKNVYLGYRIKECPSMAYKGAFKPHQLLAGRPHRSEAPVWEPAL